MRTRALLVLACLLPLASCIDQTVSSDNTDPEAAILEPAPETEFEVGDAAAFRGTVDDGRTSPEDLDVTWSSSVDGLLFEAVADSEGETAFTTDALSAGEHTITLRVLDPQGASGTDAISITVLEPDVPNTMPTCAITAPADDAEVGEGDTVVFEGTASDSESGPTELTASWSSSEDGALGTVTPSSSGAFALPVDDLTPGTHVVTLDVADPEGLNCSEFIVLEVIPDNLRPSIGAPSVTPVPLLTTDTATCTYPIPSDPEGDQVTVVLSWTVDGNDPGTTGATLGSSAFAKGQSVVCTATPSDAGGAGQSASSPPVVVADTAPTAPVVDVTPTAPVEGLDDLVCAVTTPSTDADGETVTYTVAWTLDGNAWTGATTTTTLPGDTIGAVDAAVGTWECTVTPSAGGQPGASGSDSVAVGPQNLPPSVGAPTLSPLPLYTDSTATCTAPTPTDPENDPVTLAYVWYVSGTQVGTGTTLAGTHFVKGDTVVCEVTPSDATSSGAPSTVSVAVADSLPTTPGVGISPGSPVEGVDALVCAVTTPSTDADSEAVTYSVAWTYNSSPWTGATTTTTLAGDTVPAASTAAGLWECAVTPTAASVSGTAGVDVVTVGAPPPAGKLVFVTSTLQNGNLGGVTGADGICQARANAAGLTGTFKAWISGSSYSSSPASRFTKSTTQPYVRIDGAVVANDWLDLTDGTIQNAINIDEYGTVQNTPSFAWSFTRIDGSQGLFGNASSNCYGGNCHCNNWTITATQGSPTPGSAVSKVNDTSDDWTDYSFGNFCGSGYRLKCFEQ